MTGRLWSLDDFVAKTNNCLRNSPPAGRSNSPRPKRCLFDAHSWVSTKPGLNHKSKRPLSYGWYNKTMSTSTYKCEECGLHYENEQLSKDCYDFCVKNKACDVEIIVHSVEHKKLMKERELK